MIDILYYYYYLFYTKIIPGEDPHATTIWCLSFTLSWYIVTPACLLYAFIMHEVMPLCIMIGVFITILLLMYLSFSRTKKGKKIVQEKKPLLRGSNKLSIIFTIIFTAIGLLLMSFGSSVVKMVLDRYCQ